MNGLYLKKWPGIIQNSRQWQMVLHFRMALTVIGGNCFNYYRCNEFILTTWLLCDAWFLFNFLTAIRFPIFDGLVNQIQAKLRQALDLRVCGVCHCVLVANLINTHSIDTWVYVVTSVGEQPLLVNRIALQIFCDCSSWDKPMDNLQELIVEFHRTSEGIRSCYLAHRRVLHAPPHNTSLAYTVQNTTDWRISWSFFLCCSTPCINSPRDIKVSL